MLDHLPQPVLIITDTSKVTVAVTGTGTVMAMAETTTAGRLWTSY